MLHSTRREHFISLFHRNCYVYYNYYIRILLLFLKPGTVKRMIYVKCENISVFSHMKKLWNIEFYNSKFRIYFDLVSNISNYYYDSWSYQIQLKWSALSNDFLCREILYHFLNVNFLLPQNKDLPHTSLTKLYNFIFYSFNFSFHR